MKKRTIMAVTVAGAVGLAGVLAAPRIAASQEANDPDTGADAGYCWGNGPGYGGWGAGGMGHGPGMMGGRGWRHGMMDGDGYGPGHRGGGPGAMGRGLGPIWRLDLSDAQRTQVNRILDDARHDNWTTLGKLQDARAKLRELQTQDQPDPKKVGAAFAEMSKLRQDLVEANVKTRNQVRGVLTADQRKQLDDWRSRGFGPGAGWRSGRRGPADPQR